VAVRHVLGADPDARTLLCAGTVPRGGTVCLAQGDIASTLVAADAACSEAVDGLGGAPLSALLVFDCVGRRVVLGEAGLAEERQLLRKHAAGVPLVGFYSFGEIGRVRGAGGFHNQTIVALALG